MLLREFVRVHTRLLLRFRLGRRGGEAGPEVQIEFPIDYRHNKQYHIEFKPPPAQHVIAGSALLPLLSEIGDSAVWGALLQSNGRPMVIQSIKEPGCNATRDTHSTRMTAEGRMWLKVPKYQKWQQYYKHSLLSQPLPIRDKFLRD